VASSLGKEHSRPRPHVVAYAVSLVCYALMLLPLVAIVFYSVLAPSSTDGDAAWTLTLDWYRDLSNDDQIMQALATSLWVAGAASLGATILGVSGALALHQSRVRFKGPLSVLVALPLALPELVLGLASVIWFGTLGLNLGMSTVIVGHITLTTAYVVTVINARLTDLDDALTDAALDLGASPLQALWRVTLPLLTPAIGAGAMMAFTLSFDDFMISFFTSGVDRDTLPMRIYAMIRFGINREIYALSTVLIAVTAVGMVLSAALRRRSVIN